MRQLPDVGLCDSFHIFSQLSGLNVLPLFFNQTNQSPFPNSIYIVPSQSPAHIASPMAPANNVSRTSCLIAALVSSLIFPPSYT